ncbi:unnamed protein product [Prunus armeniaca]
MHLTPAVPPETWVQQVDQYNFLCIFQRFTRPFNFWRSLRSIEINERKALTIKY